MTSSITLVNLKALMVATTRCCLFFSAPELKKMLYQQSLYFLSERNSTLLMMSPDVQTIDRVAVYGFATNFKVETRGCVLASSLMIANLRQHNFHQSPMTTSTWKKNFSRPLIFLDSPKILLSVILFYNVLCVVFEVLV